MISLLFKDIKETFQTQNMENTDTKKKNSMELELAVYVTLIIISTGIFIKLKPKLENSYFRNTYKLYYFIFLINLLNLAGFTFYYDYKIKKISGRMGEGGDPGMKGVRGDFITCSFCEHNLYIQKTKNYNKMVTLSLGLFKDKFDKNDIFKNNMDKIKNFGMDGYGLDMSEFNLDILKNPQKMKSDSEFKNEISLIFNPITRMKYLSHYLTRITMKSGYSDKISFFRPVGGNGYYPVGFSVFKSETANKSYAFLINGDIRLPVSYEPKFTFKNNEEMLANKQDNETILNEQIFRYTFLKPIPPKEYEIIEGTNIKYKTEDDYDPENENNANVKIVDYVSMGEVIIRTEDVESLKKNKSINDDINYCACIKKSCARKIKYDEVELMGIKISYNTEDTEENSKVNQVLNFMNNNNKRYKTSYTEVLDLLDVYAIWKTPMNTFVTNCFIGTNNITNGSLSYNLVNGNKDLLTSSEMTFNKRGKKYVKNLKKIKLPRIIRIIYVMVYQYNQYFDGIVYQCDNVIKTFTSEIQKINSSFNSTKDSRTRKQRQNDAKKVAEMNNYVEKLQLIIDTIGNTENKDGQKTRQELYNNDFFENISDILNEKMIIFLEEKIPGYKNIKNKLNQIPFLIDSNITLYEILMMFFDNNLSKYIAVDERGISEGGTLLTNTQKEILKLCAVCMPPNLDKDPVYMPKNSCLSFETISLSRQKLAFKFDEVKSQVDRLFELFRQNPKYCNNFSTIQEEKRYMDDKLSRTLSQIPNYYEKIENRDIEKFTDGRLKFIISQYSNLLNIMKNSCVEKLDLN